ncbi:hypothetical protein [Pseudomonas sp. AM14(2022)]|uniref:hypothetical protein n=1 Tax=Pseudomonas sp. AM14(2022) TaxID=2983371 RepID=UPI002E80D851|nr:hypothetical protein [Pseudomonas sp. AM14(2022)]
MPWYKTGTVSAVQNSNAVIGAGTAFIANSRVGDAFRGPDGGWYEVTNIASDTAMSIAPPYQGATNTSGAYALAPMQGYVKDSADALRALVNQFGTQLAALTDTDGLPEGLINKYFTDARVRAATLTGFTLPSVASAVVATDTVLSALAKLQFSKAGKGQNSDITSLVGLTTPISREQGGIGGALGFIEGLSLVWVSGTSIAIRPGSAYVPSVAKVVTYAGGTINPMTVGAVNTFIHLYLTDAGAIEQSTTAAPARYYNQAHQKTNDNSRRYIGSILINTNAAGAYQFAHRLADSSIMYTVANPESTTFRLLSGGTSVAAFNTRTIAPVTAHTLEAAWQNVGTVSVKFTPSDAGTPIASGWMVFVPPGAIFNGRCPIASDGTITYSAAGGGSANCYSLGYYFDR